jgi:uncharacterized membrane protein (DUF485 family)
MFDTFLKAVGTFVLFLLFILFIGLLIGFPVKWMANYLFTSEALTAVFGVAKLTFWRAFWLAFLCSALFKSSSYSSK